MPPAPLANVLRFPQREAEPLPPPVEVVLDDGSFDPVMEDGALKTETADGGVIIDFAPRTKREPSNKFDANLAEEMEEGELNRIASELLDGIERDNQSRQEWLQTHQEGIRLLGLVIESERSGAETSAPLEGMSTARHPLLLESVLMFQANARGELLPAAGPVKVRDDQPEPLPEPEMPPAIPGMGHNGGPPLDSPFSASPAPIPPAGVGAPGPAVSPPAAGALPPPPPQPSMVPGLPMPQPGEEKQTERQILANALEKDFNHYLTVTASEYYPDTDRMLFSVGFGGQGVKKVYNCPLRRRPVSESIAMEDFIVSNALTDLSNCARITHRIKMRPSVLKRMQLLGVYRDIYLGDPTQADAPNAVDQAKAQVIGVQPQPQDPKDADYEVYETYCELDLDEFAPKKFKGKGLPLPYRVTIERESRKVLELRRNWREDDPEAMACEYFAEFPYAKAFGFLGIGLLHILGNLTKTLTAAQRITTDNGMFSNFPGFIYAKGAGRQLTNQFRVPPGGGIGLDVGLAKLSDAVMPLPYKQVDPAWVQWQKALEELGQRLGGTANIPVAEGRADAPVGTVLALIEQATKPVGAVLKRLHSGQGKEFQLLKERFRDDPEAFWRFNKRPTRRWEAEEFVKALNDLDLVPVSDPNNPTKLHRAAKATAIDQYATGHPGLLNPQKIWTHVIAPMLDVNNPKDLLAPPMPPQAPPPPPPDPAKIANAQAKIEGDKIKAKTTMDKAAFDRETQMLLQQSRERELEMKIELEHIKQAGLIEREELKLAATTASAAEKTAQADRHLEAKFISEHARAEHDREHAHEIAEADRAHQHEVGDRDREHALVLADKQSAARLREIRAKPKPKAKPKGATR